MKYPENLSQKEIDFFIHHKIAPSDLFDCCGRTVIHLKNEMKSSGRIIGYNSTSCQKKGHRIKTRSGHCPMCDPSKIEFIRRSEKPGYVYIAFSKTAQLYQIGFSEDYEDRAKSINYTRYGGFSDWVLELVIYSTIAGRLKLMIKSDLKPFSTASNYFHDNHIQEAFELYNCDFPEIYKVVSMYTSIDDEVDFSHIYKS